MLTLNQKSIKHLPSLNHPAMVFQRDKIELFVVILVFTSPTKDPCIRKVDKTGAGHTLTALSFQLTGVFVLHISTHICN